MAWVKKMFDAGQTASQLGEMPCFYDMLQWGNRVDHDLGLPAIWHENIKKNFEYFDSIPGRVQSGHVITDLMKDQKKKAMILVGSSPILNDTWKGLLTAEKDRFLITATNSSAKFLVDHGVIPDYVFLVDGQKGKWSLDIGEEKYSTIMVCSPFAQPDTVAAWKNQIYVMPFGASDEEIGKIIHERWGEQVGQAGNSFNCAMAYFTQTTEIPIYILVGNELSFKKTYYAEGASLNDSSMYFYATDTEGNKVRTLIPLFQYKLWLDNFTHEARERGLFFFNCSKGIVGVDVDNSLMPWIANADIDNALQQVREAFEFEDEDDIVKSKKIYDLMFASGHYWPRNGAVNLVSFHDCIARGEVKTFKKGLDVGCGHGFGVYEMVKRGYDFYGADIADNTESWKELGILDRCIIAPANDMPYEDGEFDFVSCSDVMEHIPETYVEATLKEILRVGSYRFWFVICMEREQQGYHLMPTHLTLGGLGYWGPKIEAAGLKILMASEVKEKHHVTIMGVKE